MRDFLMLSMVIMLMIMSPGPDFAVVVKNSLSHGRMSGVGASVGIALANLCHVSINLLGIGIVVAESVRAFKIMQMLGAVYLMYLGYKGLTAKPVLVENDREHAIVIPAEKNTQGAYVGFYSGFFTSLFNPKVFLFFLSFFSVMLLPDSTLSTKIFYGLWISTLALLWFSVVSFFFTSRVVGRHMQAYKHWLERSTGAILIALALKLWMSDVQS